METNTVWTTDDNVLSFWYKNQIGWEGKIEDGGEKRHKRIGYVLEKRV